MFDYLTKISIINLKGFIVESINCPGLESNLSIRPPTSVKYYLEVSLNTNEPVTESQLKDGIFNDFSLIKSEFLVSYWDVASIGKEHQL